MFLTWGCHIQVQPCSTNAQPAAFVPCLWLARKRAIHPVTRLAERLGQTCVKDQRNVRCIVTGMTAESIFEVFENISQLGSFPQLGVKIKSLWNHHLVFGDHCLGISLSGICGARPRRILWGCPFRLPMPLCLSPHVTIAKIQVCHWHGHFEAWPLLLSILFYSHIKKHNTAKCMKQE